MTGIPVIGLATTEMATAIENGLSGYVDTNVENLIAHMKRLLDNPDEARRLGAGARARANQRFNLSRFIRDWNDVFAAAIAASHHEREKGLPAGGAAR